MAVAIVGSSPNGPLTYTVTGLPPGLTMSATGQITGTLSYTSSGAYAVTVTVTDPAGKTASAAFSWTVTDVNRAPTVTAADRSDNEGTTVSLQIARAGPRR